MTRGNLTLFIPWQSKLHYAHAYQHHADLYNHTMIALTIRLLLLSGLFFLSSCGVKTVQVPGQEVTFIQPPSNWKVTLFTSTSKVPAGGFLPIKLFKGNWTKSNLSTIGITGSNISGIKKKGSIKKGLLNALEGEINEFRKVCGNVQYTITSESEGVLREGIDYTEMEADIKCFLANLQNPLRAKTVIYVVESANYLYTLQFKAIDKFYDQDYVVFESVMGSMAFN